MSVLVWYKGGASMLTVWCNCGISVVSTAYRLCLYGSCVVYMYTIVWCMCGLLESTCVLSVFGLFDTCLTCFVYVGGGGVSGRGRVVVCVVPICGVSGVHVSHLGSTCVVYGWFVWYMG